MNRILIIGATGRVGRQVISQLPAAGVRVRALVRNPYTAGLPPQVEVVRGDLTLPETLDGCLDGIDTVFLVWTAQPDAITPALERIMRHARRMDLPAARNVHVECAVLVGAADPRRRCRALALSGCSYSSYRRP